MAVTPNADGLKAVDAEKALGGPPKGDDAALPGGAPNSDGWAAEDAAADGATEPNRVD